MLWTKSDDFTKVQLCRERSRPFRGFAVYAITGFTARRWAHTVRSYRIAAQFSTRARTRTPSNF